VASIALLPFLSANALFNTTVPVLMAVGFGLVFAVALITLKKTPIALVCAFGVFLATEFLSSKTDYTFQDRSFFGAHKVFEQGGLRVYGNGTTVHGYQFVDEAGARPTPLSYYYGQSPMAQVLTSPAVGPSDSIAIVGLGVGSLACYAQPGQSWEFYEIDQMVDRVARDPAMFRFMSDCAPARPPIWGMPGSYWSDRISFLISWFWMPTVLTRSRCIW